MDFASGGSVCMLMKATRGSVVEERYSVIIVRKLLIVLTYVQVGRHTPRHQSHDPRH